MAALGDFVTIRNNLAVAKRAVVVALHMFVYGCEGDRGNRGRLRVFEGFEYDETTDEYKEKAEYVRQNLNAGDLVSICNMLGIAYDVNDLFPHIFANLKKGCLLSSSNIDDDYQTDDEDVSETSETKDRTMVPKPNNDNNVCVADDNEDALGYDEVYVGAENYATNECKQKTRAMLDREVNSIKKADENVNKNETNEYRMTQYATNLNVPRFTMNFRDIEESIRPFDGSGVLSIRSWIQEFEETAVIMGWDDFQKYIFGKKSLKGLAKLFVSSERGITSWQKLKESLIDEFGTDLNSAQLHRLLAERKINKDENVHEYFLNMKELASRGLVEDSALIQYVIDGIRDSTSNKTILYGATSLKEFKAKLKCYENMWMKYRNSSEAKQNTVNSNKQTVKNSKQDMTCFNCGAKGHMSNACKNKTKGLKCFNCNTFGHISKDCPSKQEAANVRRLVSHDIMKKEIRFGDQSWSALFDTGSKFNVVSEKVYNMLNRPKLNKTNFHLVGFGMNSKGNKVKPSGNFNSKIILDSEEYNLTFHVVPNTCCDVEVILGNDICRQANITITPDCLKIKKIEDKEREKEEEVHSIMVMDACDEIELDIDVFAGKERIRKVTNMVQSISLTNARQPTPRRLPFQERTIVENQIDKWLDEGIIEQSESEFCSPIVLVKKRDSTSRLCIDYRRINKVIVKDHYPLPLIEDQLDRLQNAVIFSTIDLRNGFFHVPVNEESRKYTSFVTHNGQYQFRKVPFGLSNSPAVFQRHINAIFRELNREGIALPYVDDVIIPASIYDEAVVNLQRILETCRDYGLDINLKKCSFLKRRIQFLAKPLNDLRKENVKFQFGDEQKLAFDKLKQCMTNEPVLHIFNEKFETEVHTDASIDGYGAVLLQKSPDDNLLHPVYYMSRKTSDAERKYTSYELEVLAVIEALKRFRVYLIGIKFKLMTDCNAFTKTLDKKDLCTRVARWILLLQEYDFTVEHRPGTQMRHVDALSRHPIMVIHDDGLIERIKRLQEMDEDLVTIRDILEEKPDYKGYFAKSGILYKIENDCELLVVPKGMQNEIIKRAHELLEQEMLMSYDEQRDQIRQSAKCQILAVQNENKKYYDKRK
ncbi:uncharacterized protein LOC133326139 [Musca vetustissima]|uniref:uncharacterized protein LOC133326139 n=1 Tax=Musca vetustissima TaxID=27455 RepID=UPI002AB7C858|nr:uncharacterized protein LOC133326139 [Musca vetustissima]